MEHLIERMGDAGALGLVGALVGILFGVAAQRSAFCLRAATIEVAEGRPGPRFAVWLLAFFAALAGVQALQFFGGLDLSQARALASVGSLSGAVIGGLLFGVGMVLARGCASRLLVLASCGNLRALVTGLILTLIAQAAYRGVLSPARETISQFWTIEGGAARSLAVQLGLSSTGWIVLSLMGLLAGWLLARRGQVPMLHRVMALAVGGAVTAGWLGTYAISQASFEVVPISSITFTGPATDTLMVLVTQRSVALSFGIGLVPGVAIGACLAALVSGTWRLERFGAETPMERYLIGALLMGFGAMLAGGCAVGAGMSGGAALSLTAWVAVFFMWLGAMLTHRILDQRRAFA